MKNFIMGKEFIIDHGRYFNLNHILKEISMGECEIKK